MIDADNTLLSKWDSLVEETSEGTIFHSLNWLKIIEKHTSSKLHPLIGFKGGEIVGVFPLFRQDFMFSFLKTVLSPHGSSLVPYLGPLFLKYNEHKQDKKESILKDLQAAFEDFIQHISADYVSIVLSPGFLDIRPYQWSGYDVRPCYTYIQNLSDIESLWNGLKKQLRKNINNAERRGVTVNEGNKKDLDFLYSSVFQRLKEQQLFLEIPKEYLYDLYDTFYPRNLRIFTAEYKGEKVGGLLITCYKDKVSVWFGAVKSEFSGLYPNDLLHWTVMKWTNEQGFRKFEIIGANSPTISFFKARYNLNLQLYFSASKYSSWFVKYAKSAYLKTLVPVMHKMHLR